MPGVPRLHLLQLPVPPPAYFAATGNVPLASGTLAVAASLATNFEIKVVSPEETDLLGDTELALRIAQTEPDYLALSLYLWNTERSLWLGKEVKKYSPNTKVLIGGPEVNPDNPFVLQNPDFDIAVSGEAEETFGLLLQTLSSGESLDKVPNTAYRLQNGKVTPFSEEKSPNFALTSFPSPYNKGFLKVDPKRATYLETVRGCKSQCTYCFYPKSSTNLRTLDINETKTLVSSLKEAGAKELVFLDPTFNHRPGFEAFLDAISEVNADRQMGMFAELRAEGITPALAKKLAKAGFTKIELGLQSVNEETLKRVKRYGKPEKVAEVAKMLADQGIELLLDLIIGLPGDTPDDVKKGIDFFLSHGLEEWVQAFPLSLLPGTAMRRDAEKEGLIYSPLPPYRVYQTPTFSPKDIQESVFFAEEALDRRLDEIPRPFLCKSQVSLMDRMDFDLSEDLETTLIQKAKRPGARHIALWFHFSELETHFSRIPLVLETRNQVDPFAISDLVLQPQKAFPLHWLDKLQEVVAKQPESYLTRTLAHRKENMKWRIVLVLPPNVGSMEWRNLLLESFPGLVFEQKTAKEALALADRLGIEVPCALVTDPEIPRELWKKMKSVLDPEAVLFEERSLEENWTREVLGYGEI